MIKNEQDFTNSPQLSEEQKKELLREIALLKRTLKQLGKNQLIQLVLQQMNLAIEQQNINKLLIEQLNELTKGKEDVKNS
jgi:Glu-tRNA(Gln) amidotransferase subunit E-like FAD-binding protein